MKKCILSITVDGYALSQTIKFLDPTFEIYTLDKFATTEDEVMSDGLGVFLKKNFQNYEVVVFIMATGIVVRLIKELIEDKLTDPAVIVMDQKGSNVISLLSGHLGNANEETQKLATLIDANPVITTASDINQTISVDLLARAHHCLIADFNQAKKVTAMIVNHQKVNINSRWSIEEPSPDNIFLDTTDDQYDGTIIITNQNEPKHPKKVRLFKKNLIVSMGCRRGKQAAEIIGFIKDKFKAKHLSLSSIKAIVSLDLKGDEEGLIKAAAYFHRPFETIAREKIKLVENQFKGSEFVKNKVGVKAVSEPCGFIASNEGKRILKKCSQAGMTLSIWEAQDE